MNKLARLLKLTVKGVLKTIFWLTFGPFMMIKYNVHVVKNEAFSLKGPYFFFSNHVNNIDPFFYIFCLPRIIYFVITDAVFRFGFLRAVLTYLDFIKKKKFVSDANTIRGIVNTIKSGRIVGIFPEGRRTWNGVTMPFVASTARLVKMMKVPVVMGSLKGGHCSNPRWSTNFRRGRMDLSIRILLTADQVKTMSVDDIYAALTSGMKHDDILWAQANNISFKSKAMAQGLECYIATCPNCNSIFTMNSNKNEFYCTNCSASITMDNQYRFTNKNNIDFDSIPQWGEWQDENIKALTLSSENEVISCDDAIIESSDSHTEFAHLCDGRLTLCRDGVHIFPKDGDELFMPIDKLSGICVLFRDALAFQYDKVDYRIKFTSNMVSPYLWTKAIIAATGHTEEELGLI